jgi:hypothetical protein
MKRVVTLLALLALSAAAFAAQPTPESIDRLLALSGGEKTLEAIKPQMRAMMKASVDKALAGRAASAEEQQIIDRFVAKASAATADELTMEKFRPMYRDIYRNNFSQEEIDGLIAFYQSPVGQSFVAKMPAVAQQVLADMSKRMAPMIEKIQQAGKEMAEEMEALKK